MANGFAKTLFEQLDKKWAREQKEIDSQQQAMEHQQELEFQKQKDAEDQTFRQSQLSLTREQLEMQRKQQEFQNNLTVANSVASGALTEASPGDPSAIAYGGKFVKPVNPTAQANLAFESKRKQTMVIAEQYADLVSGGDPQRKAQVVMSEPYMKMVFGEDAVEPYVTTDQGFYSITKKMRGLNTSNPDYKGALNDIFKYNQMRSSWANPLPREKYSYELESDALSGAIFSGLASELPPGQQPTAADIARKGSQILAITHPGASEEYKNRVLSDATRKSVGLFSGTLKDNPPKDDKTAFQEAIFSDVLKKFEADRAAREAAAKAAGAANVNAPVATPPGGQGPFAPQR